METLEKSLNESKVHFHYGEFTFFRTGCKLKYHENVYERSYDTLLFVLKAIIVVTTFARSICPRKVQKAAAKD